MIGQFAQEALVKDLLAVHFLDCELRLFGSAESDESKRAPNGI